jgi:hypothetical protein
MDGSEKPRIKVNGVYEGEESQPVKKPVKFLFIVGDILFFLGILGFGTYIDLPDSIMARLDGHLAEVLVIASVAAMAAGAVMVFIAVMRGDKKTDSKNPSDY